MIDRKLAIVTIHDVNPLHSKEILKTSSELNKLKIKYNLSIVPYYRKKYNLKDYAAFCDEISSLLQSGNVELSLHGLYHQTDGKF
jgi:predicted deacetylase